MLRPGDKVFVYGWLSGSLYVDRQKATIIEKLPPDILGREEPQGRDRNALTVEFDHEGKTYYKWVHPKQCRRRVPAGTRMLLASQEELDLRKLVSDIAFETIKRIDDAKGILTALTRAASEE